MSRAFLKDFNRGGATWYRQRYYRQIVDTSGIHIGGTTPISPAHYVRSYFIYNGGVWGVIN